MKNTISLAFLLLLSSFVSAQNDSVRVLIENGGHCDWNDVAIVTETTDLDELEFTHIPVNVLSYKKSQVLNSLSDFTEKELKKIKRKAAKENSCLILIDTNYQTPTNLKFIDEEKEKRKADYIYFFILKPSKKVPKSAVL